jgi:predicted regulator of Ras-like GTPase activity (Roadblock/LC7/MglB family)
MTSTFREILSDIVEQTPGGIAAAVMASDGIPVDEYRKRGAGLELASVAVEFQRVLEQAKQIAGLLYGQNGSQPEELVLVTGQHQLLFRQADGDHFVVIALDPTGMLGKARYLVRTLLDAIREEL